MTHEPRQNVTFRSNGGHAHGYRAVPPSGSGPALLVIQEWWGLDDHVADLVDRFAGEGFVALAPDLYGGTVTHDSDRASELLAELPVERAVQDLSGAVDHLLFDPAVTSTRVGAVGFCIGGGFVLQLAAARPDSVGAAVPFYGIGPGVPEDYSSIRAPIQGHYAEQDTFYPVEQAKEQERDIRSQAGVPVEFFYYPAGHAFLNDKDLLNTYDADLAELAWRRAVTFLHQHLG
ncbi:MAG: dienelactone hydrolase family protein [Actinomycetota bacterium]|nr:MAG: dienelactone hydrolase family protein [Actinomycetota bacterium]